MYVWRVRVLPTNYFNMYVKFAIRLLKTSRRLVWTEFLWNRRLRRQIRFYQYSLQKNCPNHQLVEISFTKYQKLMRIRNLCFPRNILCGTHVQLLIVLMGAATGNELY